MPVNRTHVFLRLAIFAGIFTLLAGISGWITLSIITRGGEILAPDILGQDIVSALTKLQKHDLYGVIKGERYHSSASRGIVIEQSPEPGVRKKKFGAVQLILSAGPERLTMSDFRGFGVRQARIEISQLGLQVTNEHHIHHASIPQGHVIAHVPNTAEVVMTSAPVNLLVSKGRRQIKYRMPDLIGVSINDAEKVLAPLHAIEIEYSDNHDHAPGLVLYQNPQAGEQVAASQQVRLTVSPFDFDSDNPLSLFIYQAPIGIISKELKIVFEDKIKTELLRNEIIQPGQEIKVLHRKTGTGKMIVYLGDKVVFSQQW